MVEFRWRALVLGVGLALAPMAASGQDFDADSTDQDAYVQGNLLFLTYHEVGHLIVDQLLNVDQRGDRMSAELNADDIATWLMLPDPDEPNQDEEILAAMQGWLDSADESDEPSQSLHYPDDGERAARIACYVYGSDPDLYADLGAMFWQTIASVDCPEEHEALHGDIEAWFGDHLIPPAEADGGGIDVRYEAAGPGQAEARAYLIETRILNDAAEDISQFIRLPANVSLVARPCGAGGAEFRYSPSARQITACYEAVDWFMGNASTEMTARANADDMGSGGARVSRRPRPRPR